MIVSLAPVAASTPPSSAEAGARAPSDPRLSLLALSYFLYGMPGPVSVLSANRLHPVPQSAFSSSSDE